MSHVNHRRRNPVAKFMNQISRPQTHKSKKDYRRAPKYRILQELTI